uniref:beta-1,3-galactosyl-O-glycosyl-glycoprotein beta-1,6-N-acetylglucosaminyltransferase 7 isoform X2 n=1 Tax=Doryrhamphus excisus TaxID=161450 RepID=UPI0025AE4E1F|nr:beta-1,3-galactosyl-O-glycosyl-glycoprotein beta-1,6-N-acetylglucosaminyltransferase 7 isoform X2 [Doryrhamphus excisus]
MTRRSRSIMCQLEGAKCIFLLCLGMSVMVFSVIYLRGKLPKEAPPMEPLTCRPFSAQCCAFLPATHEQTKWHRRDCQIQSYITNNDLQCSHFMTDLHFISTPLSDEEENYPLAFILTVHKELELFVRILRAIYMPQNVYCVHVDAKAPQEYRAAIMKLVNCFENIFLSSRSEIVTYAGFSRLKADLNCMTDLVKSKVGWRKVVNLCGQDFPIKSNLELVRYMQSKEWRDINMTPGIKQPAHMRHRTQLQHKEIVGYHMALKGLKKGPPPHNMQIYFGTAYYALTRGFVNFVLKSPKARDLLEWSRDTFSPDEHYWVTLNHIKDAPGSNPDGGWAGAIRAIKWRDQEGDKHNGCNVAPARIADVKASVDRNFLSANAVMYETFASTEWRTCRGSSTGTACLPTNLTATSPQRLWTVWSSGTETRC